MIPRAPQDKSLPGPPRDKDAKPEQAGKGK